uniref:Protein max n=1 Tax=Heterorhabditis bacteriophora TaxID=37862 RepID=A0A1I7XU06_HETBA
MYSRTKFAANRSGKLSQSALSYLQSLEKNSKALRQGQFDDEATVRSPSRHSLLESSRRSSERGSLSSMISQLRQKARRESQKEESEDDELKYGS